MVVVLIINVFLRRLHSMNGENRPILTDDRLEFEKELVEVHQDFREYYRTFKKESREYTYFKFITKN
jgi:hypothetical protein